MIPNHILDLLNKQLVSIDTLSLTQVEILLLQGIWENITYAEIGQQESYSSGYLTKVAAPKLFTKLSKLFGKEVSKKNCLALLNSYIVSLNINTAISYPSGAVAIDSPFYIERSLVERKIYQELDNPGALVRIKGSKGMGKTSLLLRVLDYAERQDYQIVCLNLAQISSEIFNDLDRFLRFLCATTTQQLGIKSEIDQYWDRDIGGKVSCSLYFRHYILENSDRPIVLSFDRMNEIFNYPQLARDFLPLLRSWYEEGKRTPVWQKLRMIVVHATEALIPLKVNQSPCNVGMPIELKSLNVDQVQALALQYQLNWQNSENAELLTNFVGGHPELIQIALYHLNRQETTLPEILQSANNPEGIYYNHLLQHCLALKAKPKLAEYFNLLLNTNNPLSLEPIITYQLKGLGLVKSIGDQVVVSCELYLRYFSKSFLKIED